MSNRFLNNGFTGQLAKETTLEQIEDTLTNGRLNTIDIFSDLSLRTGRVPGVQTERLYGFVENIGNVETSIAHGLESGEMIAFVTSSTSFSIASDNAADNQVIKITYFADPTSEDSVTQNVTLNGNTPVTITSTMFRITRLQNFSPTNPLGVIYCGLQSDTYSSGKPDNDIFAVMVGESGTSNMAILYVSPNKQAFIISIIYQSDINSNLDSHLVRFRSHLNAFPNAIEITYFPYASGLSSIERIYTDPIPPLTTIIVSVQRTAGSGNHSSVFHMSVILVDL